MFTVKRFFTGCHEATSAKSRGSGKLWFQNVYFCHVYSSFDNDSHCNCVGNKKDLH